MTALVLVHQAEVQGEEAVEGLAAQVVVQVEAAAEMFVQMRVMSQTATVCVVIQRRLDAIRFAIAAK